MIKITKEVTNQVYTTISERGYVSGDVVLMHIVGKQDNEVEDLTNAVVNFTQPSYDYFIFKGDVLLEKGLLRVDGLTTQEEFTIDNNNTEYTFN